MSLSRRQALRLLGGSAIAVPLVLAGCGDDDAGSEEDTNKPVELSIFWWGAEGRAELTEQALALYTKKHPNVTFKKTWQANQGYFDKLATLTAGGDAPDIFQIDDNYLTEYAARNVTLDVLKELSAGVTSTEGDVGALRSRIEEALRLAILP